MKPEEPDKFKELYRLLNIVAKARYRAHNRLVLHATFAQFALTFLAIGLIIIPLMALGGLQFALQKAHVDIVQIAFAIVLLAYSLLLSTSRFEARAEKMQACGLILSRLLREVKPLKDGEPAPNAHSYDDLTGRYYDCLEKFDNHTELDYYSVMMDISVREGPPHRNNRGLGAYIGSLIGYYWRLNTRRAYVYFVRSLIFGHYFLAVAAMYALIYWLIRSSVR